MEDSVVNKSLSAPKLVGRGAIAVTAVIALISIGMYAFYSNTECAQFSLTVEECANLGTHQYSIKGIFVTEGCAFEGAKGNISDEESQKTYESVSTYTFSFQENTLSIKDDSGKSINVPKIRANTYSYSEQDFLLTYIFNKNGYVYNAQASPGRGCSTHYEMTLIE